MFGTLVCLEKRKERALVCSSRLVNATSHERLYVQCTVHITHADRVGSRTGSGYVTRWKCWKTTQSEDARGRGSSDVIRVTRSHEKQPRAVSSSFSELSANSPGSNWIRVSPVHFLYSYGEESWKTTRKLSAVSATPRRIIEEPHCYCTTCVPGSVRSGCST